MYRILWNPLILLILTLLSKHSLGIPLKEFQLFNGSIKVTDISGKPVQDVAVYGYCEQLHLIWPRTPDNQYTFAWKQDYFAKTDNKGIVSAEIPRGEWKFVAVGLTEAKQILCVRNTVEVNDQFSITLTPDIVIIGNLSPIEILMEKEPDEIRKASAELLRNMNGVPNFVLASGCDLPVETPIENIKAMIDAIKDFI